jgi:hypothetical protein
MLKGREPGGTMLGDGEGLGDEVESPGEAADSEVEGAPLGAEIVVPTGVGGTPGDSEVAGIGVVRGGAGVGRGVGLGVGLEVGRGVGDGVGGGVGLVTTTGVPNV